MNRASQTVAAVDVRADGIGQNALRYRHPGDLKTETGTAVADIELHAARDSLFNGGLEFALRRQNAVGFAVKAVGDDVARGEQIRNLVKIGRIVANVDHQRQPAALLLNRLRADQRLDTVFTHHAAADARLQAHDKIGQPGHRLLHRLAIDLPHVGQFVLGDDTGAGDVDQGINLGLRRAGQLVKVINMIGTGAARIDHRRHAVGHAYRIGFIMVDGGFGIAVNVGVDPACAEVVATRQITFLVCAALHPANGGDAAILHCDVDHLLIAESCRADNQVVHGFSLTAARYRAAGEIRARSGKSHRGSWRRGSRHR